jgi:Pyruvate/2-oxoacid:ferredoxin oxidoreductase delta subunit
MTPTPDDGKRVYCRSCNSFKPERGGRIVVPKSNSRSASRYWRCAGCCQRRAESQRETSRSVA